MANTYRARKNPLDCVSAVLSQVYERSTLRVSPRSGHNEMLDNGSRRVFSQPIGNSPGLDLLLSPAQVNCTDCIQLLLSACVSNSDLCFKLKLLP